MTAEANPLLPDPDMYLKTAEAEAMRQPDQVPDDPRPHYAKEKETLIQKMRRNKIGLSAGALVLASTIATASGPWEQTMETAIETMPWAATTYFAAEVGWIAGAALVLKSLKLQIPRNPLKIRARFSEIKNTPSQIRERMNRKQYNAGFGINLASAIGQNAVMWAALTQDAMPRSAIAWAWIPAVDLAATLSSRWYLHKLLRRDQ